MKPTVEELESRSNTARLTIALEYTPGVVDDGEVNQISDLVKSHFNEVGKIEVIVCDPALSPILIQRARRSVNRHVIVVALSPSAGINNTWGDSVSSTYAIAYLGSLRLNPAHRIIPEIASTISHEIGHALGLGHPLVKDPSNRMNPGSINDNAHFPNIPLLTSDYRVENPYRILYRFFHRPKPVLYPLV